MSVPANTFGPVPTLTFHITKTTHSSKFLPRLGLLNLTRTAHGAVDRNVVSIDIPTPGLMCSTNRGVIQHLSRDNVKRTKCARWVHVPFESFLQVDPPVPTRQRGNHPLHTFLGFSPSQHILSLSLRDPADGREMPANGKLFITAQSSRGSRKITCPTYRSHVTSVMPDVVFSLSDVPFTPPPHSQKRISKSIERSAQWLTTILTPLNAPPQTGTQDFSSTTAITKGSKPPPPIRLNVFLHMIGDIKAAARAAFAATLREPLEPKEKEHTQLETLDEGVSGYAFDLVPLRTALLSERSVAQTSGLSGDESSSAVNPSLTDSFASLLKASLEDLPKGKPRIVNTAQSPHEVLALIRDVGVDLFDTFWAQQAATWGVALDFSFPVPSEQYQHSQVTPNSEQKSQQPIGHNLYEERYANDFKRLADTFMDGLEYSKRTRDSSTERILPQCVCAACSPLWTNDPLLHSVVDNLGSRVQGQAPPHTRAYVHHLLHTHEMSAHALLVMHNLTVMDAFMRGVRDVLERETETNTLFSEEVTRFEEIYDTNLTVLHEAKASWREVDFARGKGRLARERAKAASVPLAPPAVVENILQG